MRIAVIRAGLSRALPRLGLRYPPVFLRKWSDFVDWLRYEYGIDLSLSRHEGEHQQTTVQIVLKV